MINRIKILNVQNYFILFQNIENQSHTAGQYYIQDGENLNWKFNADLWHMCSFYILPPEMFYCLFNEECMILCNNIKWTINFKDLFSDRNVWTELKNASSFFAFDGWLANHEHFDAYLLTAFEMG